jgi:hypothetical protein
VRVLARGEITEVTRLRLHPVARRLALPRGHEEDEEERRDGGKADEEDEPAAESEEDLRERARGRRHRWDVNNRRGEHR